MCSLFPEDESEYFLWAGEAIAFIPTARPSLWDSLAQLCLIYTFIFLNFIDLIKARVSQQSYLFDSIRLNKISTDLPNLYSERLLALNSLKLLLSGITKIINFSNTNFY